MKLKRTIVIAGDAFIDNLDVLGSSFPLNNDIMIYMHRDPKMAVHGTELSFNFDILINSSKVIKGYDFGEVLPDGRFLHMPRFNKFTQAIKLNKAALRFKGPTTNFIPVPVWCVGMGNKNYPSVSGKIAIKPLNGARGIGHYTIDTSKINVNTVVNRLGKIEATVGENTNDKILALLKEFNGAVDVHWGNVNYVGEGLAMLKEDGILMQSVIPGIIAEYRVITNHEGKPVYFQKRNIKDKDSALPQATGGGSLIEVDAETCKKNPFINARIKGNVIQGELSDDGRLFDFICMNVIGPLNSIDLFFTDEGWGIFEYCNQFGITGVPIEVARDLHLDFIHSLVCDFLDDEQEPDPEKTINSLIAATVEARTNHPIK